jgi:type II secretory pathway component PulF
MEPILKIILFTLLGLLAFVTWIAFHGGVLYGIHWLLTLPLRRAERARLVLELLAGALERGTPVEITFISAADSRDSILGSRFHLLAARLRAGLRFTDALAAVPRLLPPQITAMLRAGGKIGDLRKVLPACRQLLRDATSETQGAGNYLVVLAFVISPVSLFVFALISRRILPVLNSIVFGMTDGNSPVLLKLLIDHGHWIMAVQGSLILLLWFAVFLYVSGPRAAAWIPFLDRLHLLVPWRRKRLRRDFSTMLAVLLDAGVPEREAVLLASECTANRVFQKRAGAVAAQLEQGVKLTDAVAALDDSGEFRWRLTNASRAADGFRPALAGWHEALDAKAFQQEQAGAHLITTGLVLLNGIFVGTVIMAVFGYLVFIIDEALLW